jgi:hypothetical protein
VATEAAWLNGKNGKDHGKSKKLLTGIGLLMEGTMPFVWACQASGRLQSCPAMRRPVIVKNGFSLK